MNNFPLKKEKNMKELKHKTRRSRHEALWLDVSLDIKPQFTYLDPGTASCHFRNSVPLIYELNII